MTMEDTEGGLHPAVDGQSLDEDEDENKKRIFLGKEQEGHHVLFR